MRVARAARVRTVVSNLAGLLRLALDKLKSVSYPGHYCAIQGAVWPASVSAKVKTGVPAARVDGATANTR